MYYRSIINAIARSQLCTKPDKPNFKLAIGEVEDMGSQQLQIVKTKNNQKPVVNLEEYQRWEKNTHLGWNETVPDGITGEFYLGEVVY